LVNDDFWSVVKEEFERMKIKHNLDAKKALLETPRSEFIQSGCFHCERSLFLIH